MPISRLRCGHRAKPDRTPQSATSCTLRLSSADQGEMVFFGTRLALRSVALGRSQTAPASLFAHPEQPKQEEPAEICSENRDCRPCAHGLFLSSTIPAASVVPLTPGHLLHCLTPGVIPKQKVLSSPPLPQNTPNPNKSKRKIPKNSWQSSYAPFHIMVVGPNWAPEYSRWGARRSHGGDPKPTGIGPDRMGPHGIAWDLAWDQTPHNPNEDGTLAKKSHTKRWRAPRGLGGTVQF